MPLDKESIRRIRNAVEYNEGMYKGGKRAQGATGYKPFLAQGMMIAYAYSGVPAYGSGGATVTACTVDDTGTISQTDRTVQAFNISTTAITSGKFLVLAWVGIWIVLWEDCP